MPEPMPFAATIVDQSNTAGFQFEFRCLRCGTGYSSHVQALSSLAADAGGAALKKAGGLLGQRAGKMFGGAGEFVADHAADYVADRAADALKDQAKDRAFQAAVKEVAPQFILCPGCRRWMCRPMCFNAAAGVCQDCGLQRGTARPPASLPGGVPPPWNAAPPPPPMYAGYGSPPGQTPNGGYALPFPPPPPSAAPLPSHPVNPEYAPPSQSLAPRYAPSPPLQVHIRASRHYPGTVSLVVVDADDKVVAALHLEPDAAEDLADDLLSAAQTAMRRLADRR